MLLDVLGEGRTIILNGQTFTFTNQGFEEE